MSFILIRWPVSWILLSVETVFCKVGLLTFAFSSIYGAFGVKSKNGLYIGISKSKPLSNYFGSGFIFARIYSFSEKASNLIDLRFDDFSLSNESLF